MQTLKSQTLCKFDRKNERGAALVMVLLITALLLIASTALILEASMNTANVTDATSEQQAYYAAEAGIQSVVNVMRHNVAPNPLIDPSKTPYPPDPAAHPANKIDYFKAVRIPTSNATTPSSTACAGSTPPLDCTLRLSRWLNYGNNASFPDRVVIGDPSTWAGYTDLNGYAFRVAVSDPDNVSGTVTYQTNGYWMPNASPLLNNTFASVGGQMTIVDTDNLNFVTITYSSSSPYTKDVSSGQANTDYGQFSITGGGPTFDTQGVTLSTSIRFGVNIELTQPYPAVRVVRGILEKGTIMPGSVGNVRLFMSSRDYVVGGSVMSLEASGGLIVEEAPGDPGAPSGLDGVYRTGFEITPAPPLSLGLPGVVTPGVTTLSGTVTAPEPLRLLVRSVGFGPNGARKELESVIQKNYFNGLGAPSPLTLIGPPCTPVATCTPIDWGSSPPEPRVAPKFVFNAGSSAQTIYSGKDVHLKAFLPPIGVTNDYNLDLVKAVTRGVYTPSFGGDIYGNSANIAIELPNWLQSPRKLHTTLAQLRAVAESSGTYVAPGVTPPASGGGRYGDHATATGITYIDGDLEFSQEGGGILVVTGNLKFKGGFDFNGLIVVTGAVGITRTGGGQGSLQGNMIVAPYDPVAGLTCSDDTTVTNKLNCFLAPRYDISGGGSSDIVYNSNNVASGLQALTNFVKGVAEK